MRWDVPRQSERPLPRVRFVFQSPSLILGLAAEGARERQGARRSRCEEEGQSGRRVDKPLAHSDGADDGDRRARDGSPLFDARSLYTTFGRIGALQARGSTAGLVSDRPGEGEGIKVGSRIPERALD